MKAGVGYSHEEEKGDQIQVVPDQSHEATPHGTICKQQVVTLGWRTGYEEGQE